MKRSLSIAIATAGRFHLLDLARELHGLGHRVRFYSYVPKARALGFGLPSECHVGLLPILAPLVAWQRLGPDVGRSICEAATYQALNLGVRGTLQSCDVVIAMSGMYLEALHFARRKFDAKIVIVRGSKHVEAQDEILARTGSSARPSKLTIQRELAGYDLADMICVPSTHAAASFARSPRLIPKIRVNTYGVDLAMFPQRARLAPAIEDPVEFLFVGTWSTIKASDLLVEAVSRVAGIRVRHVGPIGDCRRAPAGSAITHLGVCEQTALKAHYASAHCLLLPSREDGFGLVLTQALASGLAVLASEETGAPDLKAAKGLGDRIELVEAGNLDALVAGLIRMRDRIRAAPLPLLPTAVRQSLGWRGFAERYERNLLRVCDGEIDAAPASLGPAA
jgi:glycosyltransferase involved in cell wall biosynthesis